LNSARIIKNIRFELDSYLKHNLSLKTLVIGISGGLDSAICAALARPICDLNHISLIGRSIPIKTNKDDEIKRAKEIGIIFCHDFKEVNIETLYDCTVSSINYFEYEPQNDNFNKIRLGNIKARLRMIYLYNLAYATQGLVLSTDNLTEYLLGFWTINGDTGDFGMIQNLWKTEVYKISRFLVQTLRDENKEIAADALYSAIIATPTDGLGITNSDLDQIGASSYEDVDEILQDYASKPDSIYKNHPVIQRHLKSQFKRKIPINIPRDTTLL